MTGFVATLGRDNFNTEKIKLKQIFLGVIKIKIVVLNLILVLMNNNRSIQQFRLNETKYHSINLIILYKFKLIQSHHNPLRF